MNRQFVVFSILILVLLIPSPSISKVFMKRDEALKAAFPQAEKIEKIEIFLSDEQASEIESISRSRLNSKLFIVYKGMKGDKILGYAIIDTHTLRTKTETVMFVVNPDGTLGHAEILAFFEPPEYMPGDNWIELFYGKSAKDSIRLGKDIPNITGATITSNSLAQTMRQMLAVVQVGLLHGNVGKKELK